MDHKTTIYRFCFDMGFSLRNIFLMQQMDEI